MAGVLISLLSGALMSIQGVWNTQMTKQTGIWMAAMWAQFSAFLVCLVLWYVTGRESSGRIFAVMPRYLLLGGAAGAAITWTVIKGMGLLGPAAATLLIVVTQMVVSYVIELFGIFGVEAAGFQWRKLIGAAIAAAGVILFEL